MGKGGEAWDVGRERGVTGDYMGTRYTEIRDRNATGSTEGEQVKFSPARNWNHPCPDCSVHGKTARRPHLADGGTRETGKSG